MHTHIINRIKQNYISYIFNHDILPRLSICEIDSPKYQLYNSMKQEEYCIKLGKYIIKIYI